MKGTERAFSTIVCVCLCFVHAPARSVVILYLRVKCIQLMVSVINYLCVSVINYLCVCVRERENSFSSIPHRHNEHIKGLRFDTNHYFFRSTIYQALSNQCFLC